MHPGDHSTSIAPSEVSRHKSRQSCWMILHGKVYDLTSFLNQHPGGATILLKNAGRDATEEFDAFHSIDTLQNHLPADTLLGKAAETQRLPTKPTDGAEVRQSQSVTNSGSRLRRIINISDFERAAFQALSKKAFAFFSAGADAGLTTAWNASAWQAIRFRPRVLKPIREVNLSQTILGIPFSAPFFIAPAGGGKLAHRSGEILMTRAAAKHGILQWVCNNAGCSQKEMADIRGEGQILYWQIYAMTDLAKSKREIREAISAGYRGFTLTVDAIIPGKREKDMRQSIAELEELEEPCQDDTDTDGLTGGISVSRPMVYTEFDWVTAIKWLRGITDLPIAVKGIQCWEDAAKCMQYGAHPWLSNHGGRQLEGAPSAAETLLEIREHCPEIFQNCEVIVDGGITKGTDIVKALALGATAVGIGRGFLYALTFGEAGVSRAIHILKQEMQTTMTLLGVTSIDQLCLSHVDASGLVYAASSAKPRL